MSVRCSVGGFRRIHFENLAIVGVGERWGDFIIFAAHAGNLMWLARGSLGWRRTWPC